MQAVHTQSKDSVCGSWDKSASEREYCRDACRAFTCRQCLKEGKVAVPCQSDSWDESRQEAGSIFRQVNGIIVQVS